MDSIKVRALKYHTFAGAEYNEGDVYHVAGDATQTAMQYVNTMALIGFVGQPGDDDEAKAEKSKTYATRELKAKK